MLDIYILYKHHQSHQHRRLHPFQGFQVSMRNSAVHGGPGAPGTPTAPASPGHGFKNPQLNISYLYIFDIFVGFNCIYYLYDIIWHMKIELWTYPSLESDTIYDIIWHMKIELWTYPSLESDTMRTHENSPIKPRGFQALQTSFLQIYS